MAHDEHTDGDRTGDPGRGRNDDLPEGVIDAAPATGWESAEVADGETSERSDAEAVEAALPEDAAAEERARARRPRTSRSSISTRPPNRSGWTA